MFRICSGKDQINYTQDEEIGTLDESISLDFGSIPRGYKSDFLELYLLNDTTDKILKQARLTGMDPDDLSRAYGEWALSSTPTESGGTPTNISPSGIDILFQETELGPGMRQYFFVRVSVSSIAEPGAKSGPQTKIKGVIEEC